MSIDRARVRECLRDYFETEDFSNQDHRDKDQDKGSITMMMKYVIKTFPCPLFMKRKARRGLG